jgi:hypothetical protein
LVVNLRVNFLTFLNGLTFKRARFLLKVLYKYVFQNLKSIQKPVKSTPILKTKKPKIITSPKKNILKIDTKFPSTIFQSNLKFDTVK